MDSRNGAQTWLMWEAVTPVNPRVVSTGFKQNGARRIRTRHIGLCDEHDLVFGKHFSEAAHVSPDEISLEIDVSPGNQRVFNSALVKWAKVC